MQLVQVFFANLPVEFKYVGNNMQCIHDDPSQLPITTANIEAMLRKGGYKWETYHNFI